MKPLPPHPLEDGATAQRLPYAELAAEIARLLIDPTVQVPPRSVLPMGPAHADGAGNWFFAMPASDARVAMAKLITYVPGNAAHGRPGIQGDVLAFDAATGERRALLHGPTVTARRTAAVSLLAAQRMRAPRGAPLLVVGAGVQGFAHAQAFVQAYGVRELWVSSRSTASAQTLVDVARTWGPPAGMPAGLQARVADTVAQALPHCPLIVTATPAQGMVLHDGVRDDAWVAAVGAFTPQMAELAPDLVRQLHQRGGIWLDSADARHEAGDVLQAGLDAQPMPLLADLVRGTSPGPAQGASLFKSCGWAGWDLAAARLALHGMG
jgi:1-piperideine-2-carboxylate/1-pyrroline-2-carboxylate reductase [NAD(P)H]